MRRSPACLHPPCSTTPPERTPLQGSSPVRVPARSVSSFHLVQEPSGLPEFSDVSLPACHGLRTPADIHTLAIKRVLHVGFQVVNTVAIRGLAFSKLYQHFRVRDHPCGLQDSLPTLSPLCSPLAELRRGPKARYGWVASPCDDTLLHRLPTGTFTLQETPSFARRYNDKQEIAPAIENLDALPEALGEVEPLDFIARLAAPVPKPRVSLTRLHGVFAPNSRHRLWVTPAKRGKGVKPSALEKGQETTPVQRRAAMTWAQPCCFPPLFANHRRN